MRDLVLSAVADTAEALGLERDKVSELGPDNLTIPRPRLDVQFLPERHERTGRLQGTERTKKNMTFRTELYVVTLPVAVSVLAEDEEWLKAFAREFVRTHKRKHKDQYGNHVRMEVTEGRWSGFEAKRVGLDKLDPMPKLARVLHLQVVYRVTADKIYDLIEDMNLNPKWRTR